MSSDKAIITNIQRFSLDDGPGIRTTVFFKGCPLSCVWCQNPECISAQPQLSYVDKLCQMCGKCAHICPSAAHTIHGNRHTIDFARCTSCGQCVDVCLYRALAISGNEYSVSQLMEELLKDIAFYKQSKGGVTFSGGEPLLYADYLSKLMPLLKKAGIHLAVDTCGYADASALKKIMRYTGLFLYDIKAYDSGLHARLTKKPNEMISANLSLINDTGVAVWGRIPLICGENDDIAEMVQIADMLANYSCIETVELLQYHKYGVVKYETLGLEYMGENFEPPSDEHILRIKEVFNRKGIDAVCKHNN